jgi:hypothetical protein
MRVMKGNDQKTVDGRGWGGVKPSASSFQHTRPTRDPTSYRPPRTDTGGDSEVDDIVIMPMYKPTRTFSIKDWVRSFRATSRRRQTLRDVRKASRKFSKPTPDRGRIVAHTRHTPRKAWSPL